MAKKLKKNGFLDGTLLSYASIVFTKLLGLFYIIPFTALIGEDGMVIYSCAYIIYNLVLNASTSGVPTAMSILVSEYNTLDRHKTKMKVYRVGNAFSCTIGAIFFVILAIFANSIASFYINTVAENSTSISVDSLANALRCVGVCLLVVPFLSILRGFLQGQKVLAVSAFSQVVEQIARIGFVLVGAYLAIRVFDFSTSTGVNIALLGAGVGAFCAVVYLKLKMRHADDVIIRVSDETDVPSTKEILKKFLYLCIPILIVAVSANIYELTSNLLVVSVYSRLGFENGTQVGAVITTYGPKIAMIISALAMGLTSTIVPEMTALVAKKDLRQANIKLNSALNIIFAIALPICVGMVVLSDSVYAFFYGNNMSDIGSVLIKFIIPLNVVSCIKITLCMAMQGLKKTKAVCVATISGILLNLVICVPLIYLCYYVFDLGVFSCIGACISAVIGQSLCVVIILAVLRKSFNFRYGAVLRTFFKTFVPALIMGAVVWTLNYFWPVSTARTLTQIVHLGAYAGVGAIIYFAILFANGGFKEIFGTKLFDKLKRR